MSGGHYDYAYVRVQEMADTMSQELPKLPARGRGINRPLRRRVIEHLRAVAELMRAIEWEDSGDGAGWEALAREVLSGDS